MSIAVYAENGNYTWITIQDDDGIDESYWGMASNPAHVLCKIINLDIEPAQIKGARIKYKIGYTPYYQKLKKHFSKPTEGVEWADIVIMINDEIVIQKSPMELVTKGWHEIPIKPELLKKGDNTIKFKWAEIPENNPRGAACGAFYMAIDTNGKAHRSCSSNDYGETFSFDVLKPGMGVDERYQGEYMVRLEIALSSEIL